jgi:hypothetical protein
MGVGGVGVHGIGGSQAGLFPDPTQPPGAGMLAPGGRQTEDENELRLPHGAGVIALAGGRGRPVPSLVSTGSIGVYAQGADAETQTVPIKGVPTVIGPLAPGAGVLGRGGVPIPHTSAVAAGVIGLAGDAPIPAIGETGDVGVYGTGPTGVYGHGPIGVRAQGDQGPAISGVGMGGESRGGQFASIHSAQVELVPVRLEQPLPPSFAVTPEAAAIDLNGPLPKDGRGGDLMTLTDDQRQCTLWFCVKGRDGSVPARWAQVLLGPSFNGVA